MRSVANFITGILKPSADALLGIFIFCTCLLAFDGWAMAQSPQQAPAPSQKPTAPAAAQGAPATLPGRKATGWVVTCNSSGAGLACRARQALLGRSSGRRVLVVAVTIPAETKTPIMVIRLPLGVYLPAGASIQFGQDAAIPLEITRCDQSGCYARHTLTEANIAAMLKGANLTVSGQNRNQEPVTYLVPSAGFSAAYAKLN